MNSEGKELVLSSVQDTLNKEYYPIDEKRLYDEAFLELATAVIQNTN